MKRRAVGHFAALVERAGADYGMSLHWGKTQALAVSSPDHVKKPDGTPMNQVTSLLYLGSVIDGDGRSDSEVSRKLGIAKADFRVLSRVWRHANVPLKEKLVFFHGFVVSRLLYGLSTMWLVTAQLRRLDGFYARCLRVVLRVLPSYLSRISNATVFSRAGVLPLSEQLLKQQLSLLGKVARSPDDGPLRRDTFAPGDLLQPQIGRYVRRRGRPRQDWTNQLMRTGTSRLGANCFERLLTDRSPGAQLRWKSELNRLFPAAM